MNNIEGRLADLPAEKKEALARLLRERRASGRPLRPRPPGAPVPLTFGQRRLWLLDQLSPGSATYNETNSLRLSVDLDPGAFRRAVQEVVRRHEVLRMRVRVVDGVPEQEFAETVSLPLPLLDLGHLPPAEREEEARRLAAEQSLTPFDLGESPLLRGSLLRLDTNQYVFVLTMHHMITDGWSMGVFSIELLTLYWSFAAGHPSPLPELTIQYGDYAVWQHHPTSDDPMGSRLDYWKAKLADAPTLALPTDRPRPAEFTFRGARRELAIEGPLYEALGRMAGQHDASHFIILLAAFAVLLHRYTEQDDMVIGVPVAGRSGKELRPLIGFFVNTLALRLAVSPGATFAQMLGDVRRVVSEGFANEDVPFDRIVSELQPRRDKSRNPIYQVMLQLFPANQAGQLPEYLRVPFTPVDSGIAKFDLSLELTWTREAIRGHIEYCTDLFDPDRIERMVAHYLRILELVTSPPEIPISCLDFLTDEERSRPIGEWNATASPFPAERTLPEVFREQAERSPEAVALRFRGRTIRYDELADRSAAVARALSSRGVAPGDRVGLHLVRGPELIWSMLGILGSGAAYVPLDPAYPPDRLAYLADDSGVKVVISAAEDAPSLRPFRGPVLAADAMLDGDYGGGLRSLGIATDVAYIMYTSGTTGQPKGVAVTHRNILRLVRGVRYVALDGDQTMLQFATPSFDASTFEVWGCLLNGGTLAIYPSEAASLEELGGFIRSEKINVLFLTTGLFTQMVEHCAADLRGVAQVITGGEPLHASVARAAWRALPYSRIINAYGPTECTTFATTYTLGRPEALVDPIPIGLPIENTTAYVLDRNGNVAPFGVPGELYLGGEGVAAGYWNRPVLTAERFVPDPYSPGRLYRTGDIASRRADGNLVFRGRRDRQVKLSGFRVEPGEVEAALLGHPGIRAAAVVVVDGEPKSLSAFYEVGPGLDLPSAEVHRYLAEYLPRHMIPSRIDAVDRLPLTANGKVDLDALARRDRAAPAPGLDHVGPRSRTEQQVGEVWSELLRPGALDVTANFFELGGQSLLATRLLSRVRNLFGVAVTMSEFFDRPTVEGLAEMIDHQLPTVPGAAEDGVRSMA